MDEKPVLNVAMKQISPEQLNWGRGMYGNPVVTELRLYCLFNDRQLTVLHA